LTIWFGVTYLPPFSNPHTIPKPMAPNARFVLFYARFILPFALFYAVILFKIKNQEKTENPFNVNRVGKLKFKEVCIQQKRLSEKYQWPYWQYYLPWP
jgi:hypothetical protein